MKKNRNKHGPYRQLSLFSGFRLRSEMSDRTVYELDKDRHIINSWPTPCAVDKAKDYYTNAVLNALNHAAHLACRYRGALYQYKEDYDSGYGIDRYSPKRDRRKVAEIDKEGKILYIYSSLNHLYNMTGIYAKKWLSSHNNYSTVHGNTHRYFRLISDREMNQILKSKVIEINDDGHETSYDNLDDLYYKKRLQLRPLFRRRPSSLIKSDKTGCKYKLSL